MLSNRSLWCALAIGASSPMTAATKHAVYLGLKASQVKEISEGLQRFGIECHGYQCEVAEKPESRDKLIGDLAKSKLLVSGQYVGDRSQFLFSDELLKGAVGKFLEAGGTLFFDYNGLPLGGACQGYLGGIGVDCPRWGDEKRARNYWSAIVPEEVGHALLAEPNRMARGETKIRGFGFWQSGAEGQVVLLRPNIDPTGAGLVLQERVLGQGRVIFNRAYSVFRFKKGARGSADTKLLQNLLTYVFGETVKERPVDSVGPIGRRIPVWDPYETRGANLAWASELAGKPWWDRRWQSRVPILVHEPIGMARHQVTLSVTWQFPEGTASSSIRVVTPFGEELPCQTAPTGDGNTEVLFYLDEIEPYQNVPLFVYFDGDDKEPRAAAAELRADTTGQEPWERNFRLENDKLVVELARDYAMLRVMRPKAGRGKNQVPNFGRHMGQGWSRIGPMGENESAVVEDGPLRATVEYRGEGWMYRCWLHRGGELLHFEGRRDDGVNSGGWHYRVWLPGGDGVNDRFFYETVEGVRQVALKATTYHPLEINFQKFMKEGWYAVEDSAKRESVGELFDLADAGSVKVSEHFQGNRWQVGYRVGSKWVRGALVSLKGGWQDVRDAYLAWKNPPQIHIGDVQTRDAAPAVRVPQWGKDSIRIVTYSYGWYEATKGWRGTPAETARAVVSEVLRMGGNYVNISGGSHVPIWESKWRKETRYHDKDWLMLKPLIDEAHRRGVGVRLALHGMPLYCTPEGEKPCLVRDHDRHMEAYREIARHQLDAFCPLCEPRPPIQSREAAELFRRRCGKAFQNLSMDLLRALPHQQAVDELLFRTSVLKGYIKGMADVFREVAPRTVLAVCASPNNLGKLDNFYDFEALYELLDSPSMDLYGTQTMFLRYWITYLRGLAGNGADPRKTVHCWTGCVRDSQQARLNPLLHLLVGDPYHMFFTYTGYKSHPEIWSDIRAGYQFMDYTGIGRALVECPAMKFVAVYRDRAGFIDSVKKGEAIAGGVGGTTAYTRRVSERLLMPNVPTDVVVSQYLTAKSLTPYKFVIVPSDPVLGDRDVQELLSYAESGGCLMVEGECINNQRLASALGVRKTGDLRTGSWDLPLEDATFRYHGRMLPTETTDATAKALSSAPSGPAILSRSLGTGRAVYVSAETLSNDAILALLAMFGELPIQVAAEHANSLVTSVFTDGRRSILGVHNRLDDEVRPQLGLRFLPAKRDQIRALDLVTGEMVELKDGVLTVQLAPREVKFVLIGPEAIVRLPRMAAVPVGRGHSQQPGMSFLRIKEEVEAKAQAPHRMKDASKIYVGVFKGEGERKSRPFAKGAKAIFAALREQRNVVVEYLPDLGRERVGLYDVVIIPNMGHPGKPTNLNEDWQTVVREFVKAGGGVLVCQHAVGYEGRFPALFPSVAMVKGYVPVREMTVVEEHPVATGESLRRRFPKEAENPAFSQQLETTRMRKGEIFRVGFNDYDALIPGPQSTTVVRSVLDPKQGLGGDPVVVVGRAGQGRVVLSGMTIGYKLHRQGVEWIGPADELTPGETKVLVNSVYWLAEKE